MPVISTRFMPSDNACFRTPAARLGTEMLAVGSIHDEDDLSRGAVGFTMGVCLGNLGERVHRIDVRVEPALLGKLGDRAHACLVGLDEHAFEADAEGGGLLGGGVGGGQDCDQRAALAQDV
jgi:hypothetical protein